MVLARRIRPTRVVVTLALVAAAVVPVTAVADPGQQEPSPTEERRSQVRARQGEVALQVDLLEAREAELTAALEELATNVATQRAELEEADRVVAEAEEDLEEAAEAVAAAEDRIHRLEAASDQFVVEAYMQPPVESVFDALDAGSISEATIKRTLLDMQSDSDADVLDRLAAAHDDLEAERQAKRDIATEAAAKRAAAADELAQLEAAEDQQAAFAADVEVALDRKLGEAWYLAALDRQLSAQIAAEQAELARRLEAARRAEAARQAAAREAAAAAAAAASSGGGAGSGPGGGPGQVVDSPGGLATVTCPRGGSLTVADVLAGNLQQLLNEAAADGVGLCGWGYRSTQRQIELRRQHCGGSHYAVHVMPSWRCSPPTARPGLSMHEQGLAVDFTCEGGSISSHGNRCFRWLAGDAGSYGLYNLPSEPWHWSVNGR